MKFDDLVGTSPQPAVLTEHELVITKKCIVNTINFTLVTDGTADNRFVYIVITDANDTELFRIPAPIIVTASVNPATFKFGVGQKEVLSVEDTQFAPLPEKLVLEIGYKIKTETTDMETNDRYGELTAFGKLLGSG